MKCLKPLVLTLIVLLLACLYFSVFDEGFFNPVYLAAAVGISLLATWHVYVRGRRVVLLIANLLIAYTVFAYIASGIVPVDTDPSTHMDTDFAYFPIVILAAGYTVTVFAVTWVDSLMGWMRRK